MCIRDRSNLDDPISRLFARGLDTNSYYNDVYVNSSKTQDAAFKSYVSRDSKHADRTTREIINNLYRVKTHYDDIFSLKDFIVRVYSNIVSTVPYYTEMRYNQTTNTIEKANVFRDDLGFISKEQLFDLLVMVRLLELNRYTESEHHRISKKVLNILKTSLLRMLALL